MATKEKPRRRWGQGRGFQRAVRLGELRPGLRTERRRQNDTLKRKRCVPRYQTSHRPLIQLECCAYTTVQRHRSSASKLRGDEPKWHFGTISVAFASNATASGGPMPKPAASLAISVAPSPQRQPKSSILAGAASFGHGTGMRLGSGAKPLPFGAARGQSWATSSTIFCCSPVWHYSSRELSSRPRACSSDAAPLLSDAPRAVCAST